MKHANKFNEAVGIPRYQNHHYLYGDETTTISGPKS